MKYIKIECCGKCDWYGDEGYGDYCFHADFFNEKENRIVHKPIPNRHTIPDFCPLPDLQQWISVEASLPEESGYYLCWEEKFRAVDTGYFDGIAFETNICDGYSNVTHWMPYPKGP